MQPAHDENFGFCAGGLRPERYAIEQQIPWTRALAGKMTQDVVLLASLGSLLRNTASGVEYSPDAPPIFGRPGPDRLNRIRDPHHADRH